MIHTEKVNKIIKIFGWWVPHNHYYFYLIQYVDKFIIEKLYICKTYQRIVENADKFCICLQNLLVYFMLVSFVSIYIKLTSIFQQYTGKFLKKKNEQK